MPLFPFDLKAIEFLNFINKPNQHEKVTSMLVRPQSAKIGARGYWGHGSEEIDQNSSNKNIGRKQVAIMKPDLTTHDFSRILPKKIHQDKERLYS